MCVLVRIHAEITVSPRDAIILINQTAVFTCVTHSVPLYVIWRVNGTDYNKLPFDIRGDLEILQETVEVNEKYTLTILGRAEYNGTSLQCVAEEGSVERESKNATLVVQGTCNQCREYVSCISTLHCIIYSY